MSHVYSPGQPELTDALTAVVSRAEASQTRLSIVDRRRLHSTQTHPADIVWCRTVDGRQLQFLCKYGSRPLGRHEAHGHRRGVPYEAMVYEHLLVPWTVQVPPFWGTYVTQEGITWLVLGYLEGAERLHWSGQGSSDLELAARWLSGFQNLADDADPNVRSRLVTYDADYYAGWAHRTLEFAGPLAHQWPWLTHVVQQFVSSTIPILLDSSTVTHGEFYPTNALLWQGRVYVIDWESAAMGSEGIDLACLIDGWPPETADRVVASFRRERLRPRTEGDLATILSAARLYLRFRWLGDRREWTTSDAANRRFANLHAAAAELGMV